MSDAPRVQFLVGNRASITAEGSAGCIRREKLSEGGGLRPLYIEEIQAFNGGGRRRRPKAWNRFMEMTQEMTQLKPGIRENRS